MKLLDANGNPQYSFKSDTLFERNDSIFVQTWTISGFRPTSFLFSPAVKGVDSFSIDYVYVNSEKESITFYVDSVVYNGRSDITYFHNKTSEYGYSVNFAWRDSIGDLIYGPNYLDIFNWLDFSIEYLAYSKNNKFYFMDGRPWQTAGDTSCSFSESIKKLKVGINDIEIQQFSVYPNPFTNSFQIRAKGEGNYSIEVLDINGMVVYTKLDAAGDEHIALDCMPKGVYIATITSGGQIHRHRLIKAN